MSAKKYQLENYRKYLLNRVTATPHFIEYIENSLASEDEAAHHSFHKIMVHNWAGSEMELFDALIEYFTPTFIPVNCSSHGALTTFYTSSLSLVLKITKLDFMFPHQRNMFNIDILFNDKNSADCFENRVTIEDIVAGVVSSRFSDKCELDLSNFCNDPEFLQKKINFYKIHLLSSSKILMLRVGRDTKCLNLSNNNLCTAPVEILNFFIKGDLTGINLSNNNIPTLQELHRVSSKIEKLWLEGNPLCDELDPTSYVKQIIMKFPRISELDGIRLNEHGVPFPIFKNYLDPPDRRTKMIVDKFLSLYFGHYDHFRKHVGMFYAEHAVLTISNEFTDTDKGMEMYATTSRNILCRKKSFNVAVAHNHKIYRGRHIIKSLIASMPKTLHDPTSFTVDVLVHTKKNLCIIVEGVFKDMSFDPNDQRGLLHFRRTFIFNITTKMPNSEYHITNEMFYVGHPTKEMIDKSFKDNTRGTNPHSLFAPDADEVNALCYAFTHVSQLKKAEAEERLKAHNYDFRVTLMQFLRDYKANKIPEDKFIEEDDFSDLSSLVDDELD